MDEIEVNMRNCRDNMLLAQKTMMIYCKGFFCH